MKRDNHGFSLIEMIVVIALLGILVGGSFIAYSVVHSATATEVAEDIGAGMAETRMKTMTQMAAGGWSFRVNSNTDTMSIVKNDGVSSTSIDTALSGFDMSYNPGTFFTDITFFEIAYEVETGTVKSVNAGGIIQNSGTGVLRITVNGKVKDIYIYFATGKYEIK